MAWKKSPNHRYSNKRRRCLRFRKFLFFINTIWKCSKCEVDAGSLKTTLLGSIPPFHLFPVCLYCPLSVSPLDSKTVRYRKVNRAPKSRVKTIDELWCVHLLKSKCVSWLKENNQIYYLQTIMKQKIVSSHVNRTLWQPLWQLLWFWQFPLRPSVSECVCIHVC